MVKKVSRFLAAALLSLAVASCESDGSGKQREAIKLWPLDAKLKLGQEISFTDSDGARFAVASAGPGTTPEPVQAVTVEPGYVHAYTVFYVRNEDSERAADIRKQMWLVLVPAASTDRDRATACDMAFVGLCGGVAKTCHYTENAESQQSTDLYDHSRSAMPVGATWRITCYATDQIVAGSELRGVRLFRATSPVTIAVTTQEVPSPLQAA
ncbi:MAG TPA: hypothetical protein VF062_20780 [Candidatus Limnocylindrales bacterium]